MDSGSTKQMGGCSRRNFLMGTAMASFGTFWTSCQSLQTARGEKGETKEIAPCGPGSKYTPRMKAAFVRRKESYGIAWPGEIYDGKAAEALYREKIAETAQRYGIQIDVRSLPIYSLDEGAQWIEEAKAGNPDGLLVVMLDRQQHSWPTAQKAADSGIPTVIFAPIGTAFTTNTNYFAHKKGVFVSSANDFEQAAFGMKMIKALAKLRETRFVVIQGNERKDARIPQIGTSLRYVPASLFFDLYNQTPVTDEVERIANEYWKNATNVYEATRQDVINGVKSYVIARTILEREEGDGITMDCLGALRDKPVSLPCISWSRMLDRGIPAACEADIGAALTHAVVQYLFDRPGFQQDPVPDTAKGGLIGAHCTCPTRLNGFNKLPEPYRLSNHHGKRDAVPIPVWKIGNRATVAILELSRDEKTPHRMIVSAGGVMENIAVPPAGGCVVSVLLKLDGVEQYLDYPGFHQIFFYGDFKNELRWFCELAGIEPVLL